MIRAVENKPDCYNAACHAHPSQQRILGVIDAQVSLANVDRQLADHQRQLVVFSAVAALIICLVSVVVVWLMVHRPIKDLMAGTRKVAGGDLAYRLPVRSHDELGKLAASFNKMTADLAEAHAEITAWARTLEERVQRKTLDLERAHTSLVASEKMASLGKLAATVAHEVNNPLFGMLTYARLTLKGLDRLNVDPSLKAEMTEHVRLIERESRRCGDIMQNLLTFARHAPPRPQSCDLNTLIQRALRLVHHQLDLQGVDLEESLPAEMPNVWCDPGQIQQVALVLLVNACEAMPHGGRLRVSTERDAGAQVVRLRVADTGVGISPDVLPEIFEPFFTTKEEQQRTGLGLAVARSIVDQHAGTITVSSVPGQGTEFVVTLPQEPHRDTPPASFAGREDNRAI
jgi:two-component system NtrC family sensor kinase